MVLTEKRPLPLHHSLHPSLTQVTMNSLSRERLVDNVTNCFGDLDSIFSLSGSDKMNCMTSVGWGELGRVTTQGLLKRRTMLGAKPRDSTDIDTSGGRYLVSRIARIKKKEDVIDLNR